MHSRDSYRYKVDNILLLLYGHTLHTVLRFGERIAPDIIRKMMNHYNKTLILEVPKNDKTSKNKKPPINIKKKPKKLETINENVRKNFTTLKRKARNT